MRAAIAQDRKLRIFAFDPHIGKQLRFSRVNEIAVLIPHSMEAPKVPPRPGEAPTGGVGLGPVGEYLEVVDYDPASGLVYSPVNLDAHVASQGLAPMESNPQFHQQMVYAVAMKTIAAFEAALGRVALWAPRLTRGPQGEFKSEEYVGRLRVYPHAIREANAYYAPGKKALLFGYFAADDRHPRIPPGSMIFTCLSHDIVAHEVTHALLDGMHSRFIEASNPDVLALHEAFADVVAIFQHFSHPEVLADQIAKTRGDLETENLLGQLAQEFGRALGRGGALRDALGEEGQDGVWRRRKPDRSLLARATKPHQRGAILVAAVFDAFVEIYKTRTQDLFRIATNGTGILPLGAIHPDLANRLAYEAAKTAERMLRMCIRALDYCPPVDVRFGDYLRAIITADHDLFPVDERRYRVAIIESFVAWGIVPEGMSTISVDTLLWPSLEDLIKDVNAQLDDMSLSTGLGTLIENPSAILDWIQRRSTAPENIRDNLNHITREIARILSASEEERVKRRGSGAESIAVTQSSSGPKYDSRQLLSQNLLTLGLEANREVEWWVQKFYSQVFWAFLTSVQQRDLLTALHLTMEDDAPWTVNRSELLRLPTLHVQAVRMATRRGDRDQIEREYVVEVVQRRRGYFDPEVQRQKDADQGVGRHERGDFTFRRGCTLLIDARTFRIRRVIRTRGDVTDDRELNRVREFLKERQTSPANALDGGGFGDPLRDDDFAHLHRSAE
jgi:hypothetical protein